jgi:uncharacterized RDD family membrane protein YckC
MQPDDPNRPPDPSGDDPSRPTGPPEHGQPEHGQPQYRQPPPAQPPYGQPQYGQPPPAQPPYGQPAYGEPQYGQPQYGQPPPAQPPYGEPAYGEPRYAQPQQGYPPPPGPYPGAASFPGGAPPYPPADAYPVSPYAPWIVRVASFLIDWVIPAIVIGIGQIILYGGTRPVDAGYAGWRVAVSTILDILSVVVWGYNRWYRAGRTGQSWGKQALSTKLIGEASGQPIGTWRAFVRDVCHIFDNLCGIFPLGYLWPLWDRKRQIFSDKIMHTVVIRV